MFSVYDFKLKTTIERIGITILLSVLILFGIHTKLFSLVAFVISALVIIFDKSSFRLTLMVYLMLMAHIFKISASGQSYFTFLMFIYIGVELIKEKRILTSVVFFMLYVVMVQFARGGFSITDDLKLFGNILFIGYAVGSTKHFTEKEKDTLILYYIAAIIVSSVMRFFESPFFPFSDYTAALNTEGFGAGSDAIVRFSGLYQDPNYYSVNLIIGLCLLVILFYKSSVNPLICALLAGTLIYFGTLTYSKSFILMLILPFLLLMYANSKSGRKGAQILSVLIVAGGVLFLMSSNSDYFTSMQKRLDTGSSLTTGRSDIWMEYLTYTFEHPEIALFGAGIGAPLVIGHAMHNVYVEVLYHLGLIGGGLLIFVIAESGFQHRSGNRKNMLSYSILFCVLLMYAWLNQLHDYEFPIHFTLAYMILLTWDAQPNLAVDSERVCTPLMPAFAENKIRVLQPHREE